MSKKAYKFDDFYLESSRRKLLHESIPVQLSPKAFEILLLLVQRQGETVKKAEFLQKIWSDSFVEESNLAIHVSALRRILGERRGERKFIETIKGQDYCFVCSAIFKLKLALAAVSALILNLSKTTISLSPRRRQASAARQTRR